MFHLISDTNETYSLAKWSSLELLADPEDNTPVHTGDSGKSDEIYGDDSIFNQDFLMRVASDRGHKRQLHASASLERGHESSLPGSPSTPSCSTTILILVMHAGSVLGKILLS